MPSHHVNRFQAIAPISAAATTVWRGRALVDQSRADRLGDRRAGKSADEVERRRHHDRRQRRQRARRNGGGDRVGSVVKAVDVVEDDCQHDRGKQHQGRGFHGRGR